MPRSKTGTLLLLSFSFALHAAVADQHATASTQARVNSFQLAGLSDDADVTQLLYVSAPGLPEGTALTLSAPSTPCMNGYFSPPMEAV